MSRLPLASRDKVPEDQVGLFDEMVKKHGLQRHATASVFVRVPRIWEIDRQLGDYLMRGSSLTPDIIDLIFLVVGRELDCQFMWHWHAAPALKTGVSAEVIEALRHGTELPKMPEKHLTVIQYGREIYRNHLVSHGTFSRARDLFGERGIVEMGLLYGRLLMHALVLNGTDADLRPDRAEPILHVY